MVHHRVLHSISSRFFVTLHVENIGFRSLSVGFGALLMSYWSFDGRLKDNNCIGYNIGESNVYELHTGDEKVFNNFADEN